MSELIRDMQRSKKGKFLPGERKMHWLDTLPDGGGVYALEFVRGEEVIGRYVGSTHDFDKRRYQHFTGLCAGEHERKQMQRFFDENRCWVRFVVLERPVAAEDRLDREGWWIQHLKAEFNKSIPKGVEDEGWQPERETSIDDSWEPYSAAQTESMDDLYENYYMYQGF